MFSDRLRHLRKLRGLSQESLGKIVNTTKATISNYENEYSSPSNSMLVDLAKALNTTTDYLLGNVDSYERIKEKDFDPLVEINKLIKEYGITDSGFFDIDKWKAMGPEEIAQLENYFQFLSEQAKKKNLDK
ncbi:helix-turn-helix domain-containing protein [Aquibacillus rhizosphaerae]|uniref:Helix-turn-helix transcriptional regulator n=1 Tax=Aquibacillus rhizosphaerae TaxID=3051431 RepID=A0ABT7LBL0_9BACI|nr:helix-turn-helix transcriptional regulator [Aquibacillus sp. LR5S19]MDL4842794.1 helix-turn-helix transcriptional regulator [Aquibacillus sp. LR5S19]